MRRKPTIHGGRGSYKFLKRCRNCLLYTSYKLTDTFMGFHCGNTPLCKLCNDAAVKFQLIQNLSLIHIS